MHTYFKFVRMFDKFKLFFLWPAAILYLISQIFLFDSYTWIIAGILLYYPMHQLGYAMGGHKLFSHRSYTPVAWYPYVAAIIGSICFQGNPVMSALIHRQHHRYADTEHDPHSPCHGRWHAFLGWAWAYTPPPPSAKIAADLINDYPFLKTYEKIEWMVMPAFYIIMALISKWLMLAFLLGSVLSLANGLCINAFAHNPGITDANKATNNKFLARWVNPIFFHKDHHADGSQYDYSAAGVRDFSATFIERFLIKRT
jgi:stearoyl-CoA desaturase (delta-9 desaturase)